MRTRIIVQAAMFDLNAEIAALADGAAGAVASFTGHVRRDGNLSSLTLEHYPAMTQAEIARMAEAAGSRWPLTGVTVIHRIGRLTPGEAIVLVATAAPHRAEAFAACEFLVDYLKTHAPFWKEEERDGGRDWVTARDADTEAAARWRK
jgi:molybdopterin synthase catalytic subunit